MNQIDFSVNDVFEKPLMAHLSSVENGEPRDSPVGSFMKIIQFGSSGRRKIALLTD